jgi:hypothetical protein
MIHLALRIPAAITDEAAFLIGDGSYLMLDIEPPPKVGKDFSFICKANIRIYG